MHGARSVAKHPAKPRWPVWGVNTHVVHLYPFAARACTAVQTQVLMMSLTVQPRDRSLTCTPHHGTVLQHERGRARHGETEAGRNGAVKQICCSGAAEHKRMPAHRQAQALHDGAQGQGACALLHSLRPPHSGVRGTTQPAQDPSTVCAPDQLHSSARPHLVRVVAGVQICNADPPVRNITPRSASK
jgi:hypothetical protein